MKLQEKEGLSHNLDIQLYRLTCALKIQTKKICKEARTCQQSVEKVSVNLDTMEEILLLITIYRLIDLIVNFMKGC